MISTNSRSKFWTHKGPRREREGGSEGPTGGVYSDRPKDVSQPCELHEFGCCPQGPQTWLLFSDPQWLKDGVLSYSSVSDVLS